MDINLVMPREMRDQLLRRADAELRSASNYVGRILVEVLAKRGPRRES